MKRSIYIRLLLHLTIAVILITCLVGALVYRYTTAMLKEEVIGANNELLLQTSKIVNQSLGEVQQIATTLALNSDVQKSVWLPWNLEEEYRFLKNTGALFDERINSSNYVHSIYLYSSVNRKLISSSGITDMADFSYRSVLDRFVEGPNSSSWLAASMLTTGGDRDNVISFLITVPFNSVEKKGVLLINLKEDVLYNAVVNTNNRKLGNVAVLNSNGEVLSYKDKSMLLEQFKQADIKRISEHKEGYFVETIGGKKMFVSFLSSSFNNWIYITLNPHGELFKRSNEVIRITLLISVISLAAGMLLMVVVSRRHYQPVRNMVQALISYMEKPLPKAKYGDEFGFIRESIDRLHHENEEFKTRFRGQELILKDHLLLNLLSGKTADEDEMIGQLNYYHLNLEPHGFLVMAMRVHLNGPMLRSSDEQVRNLIHFQIRTICEDAIGLYGKGAYISRFHKHDVIILNTGHWDSANPAIDKAKELAFRIKNEVTSTLEGVVVTFGIGGNYELITEIPLSYNEATEALLHERIAGIGSILSIHDLDVNRANRNQFIAYRQQVDKLVGDLKSGHLDKVKETKDSIINQLEHDGHFGLSYKNMILLHLLNALVTVRVELAISGEETVEQVNRWHHEFAKLQNLEEITLWLDRILTSIAGDIEHRRDNKNAEVIAKLAAYIRDHYREPLGLQLLADMAYMNSQYLSKLFKEMTGSTFIDYLTETRFREACRLLKETDRNINDIAEATGFGQKQNLIRTFKKMTGLTPTEYRNGEVLDRLESLNTNE
ncbi:helix-turn-helix domain-containing protein [Paenibacillus sp. LMG 31461]|uniref:Helix-turn-helix domain-containing protein n=1 Tax=Paenibacillus plantarum TaxID=2654975 RepID=A0ABX1X2J2_9BACL|nr:helix-turn-helix domain-containing protein [Paenibacillus plantarum]NOU62610.1 helix-turn-helix domain-containing protein [Paenibacillus plantarum]